jgi:hypothetical protein
MYEDESGMKDIILSIQQCAGIHIIKSKESIEVIIDIINGVVVNYDMDDISDGDISDIEEEIIKEDEYNEVPETPLNHEILPPDNIYNKATVPVILSEGEPLKKRAKKIPEDEQQNRSDKMKLSTKVKKQHKNDNSTKPDTPLLQNDFGTVVMS